jgi:dTDP-4-dehydrorhamnose 3,5-epimerase
MNEVVLVPQKGNIEGVRVQLLRSIPDERGCIYHGVRRSDIAYEIAEVYFKRLFPEVINGWHVHDTMTLSYITIFGLTKLVLVDLRSGSLSYGNLMEIYCGDGNHCRVEIPPGVANASQALMPPFSIFANTPNMEHDPNLKYRRVCPIDGFIKFKWNNKHY